MKISKPTVDPAASYCNVPGRKSTLHASAGLVIDVVKDSSDDFPSPKAVVDKTKPLPSLPIDPIASYENKKSTLYASAGLVIGVVKESSDVFTPLKAVAGGLSAILKHYDVRHAYSFKPFAPLTSEPANNGEP